MKVNIWHTESFLTLVQQVLFMQSKWWMFCSESTIKAILVDNTNANTGCEGGIVAILEKKIFFKSSHNWFLTAP